METKTLGQVLWDELSDSTEWEVIPNEDQAAFEQAAQAVITEYEARKWQPIDSAPKNMQPIFGAIEGKVGICYWLANQWVSYRDGEPVNPIYWQALPTPPKVSE